MNNQEFKLQAAFTAARLVEEGKPADELRFADIAGAMDCDTADLLIHFRSMAGLYSYFYKALLLQYRQMIGELEEFESLSFAEKTSNMLFTLFDMLDEHPEFVQRTIYPIVLNNPQFSLFEQEMERLIQQFADNDPAIPTSARLLLSGPVYRLLAGRYCGIIRFYLTDESESKEKSLALVEKFNGLLQELLYFSGIDKAIDLARFLWREDIIPIPAFLK